MVLEKVKARIKRKKVKRRRMTNQRTLKGVERGLRTQRKQRGTRKKPIASTFRYRKDVLVGVSVAFGMIGWIQQAEDVLGVVRRVIVHWSAQDQSVRPEQRRVTAVLVEEKVRARCH